MSTKHRINHHRINEFNFAQTVDMIEKKNINTFKNLLRNRWVNFNKTFLKKHPYIV